MVETEALSTLLEDIEPDVVGIYQGGTGLFQVQRGSLDDHPMVPCEKTRVVRQEMGHTIIHLLSNSLQTEWFWK